MTIAKRGLPAKTPSTVCGKKQTLRLLAEGTAARVILAADADQTLKDEIRAAAALAGVRVETYPTKKGLGEAMGIDVACGVIAVAKQ